MKTVTKRKPFHSLQTIARCYKCSVHQKKDMRWLFVYKCWIWKFSFVCKSFLLSVLVIETPCYNLYLKLWGKSYLFAFQFLNLLYFWYFYSLTFIFVRRIWSCLHVNLCHRNLKYYYYWYYHSVRTNYPNPGSEKFLKEWSSESTQDNVELTTELETYNYLNILRQQKGRLSFVCQVNPYLCSEY